MIIKRLTIHNFGVYAGTNTFNFHGDKPVVLIGGLNGRGKTTFLEAVLISLYGPNSFAYRESNYNSYGKYLRSYVNLNDWSKSAYLELEFQMSKNESDIYMVHREWNALTAHTIEKIIVTKNGKVDPFLGRNWGMFIESILPSAISNFFFFDGEKIAELAVDETNSEMKESIRAMLGLNILDVLNNDLTRISNKIQKNIKVDTSDTELRKMKSFRDDAKNRKDALGAQIKSLETQIDDTNTRIEKANNDYLVKGGLAEDQRIHLAESKATLEAQIVSYTEQLLESAGSSLPLYLTRHWLKKIQEQSKKERSAKLNVEVMKQIEQCFEEYKAQHIGTVNDDFIEFIQSRSEVESTEPIYSLSDKSYYQLNTLLDKELNEEHDNSIATMRNKHIIEEQSHSVESHLSLDINKASLRKQKSEIDKLNSKLTDLKVMKAQKILELKEATTTYTKYEQKYSDLAKNYIQQMELRDEANRTFKYTETAKKILQEYNTRLQARKVGELAQTITDCYKVLANKKTLINHIEMDQQSLNLRYINDDGKDVVKEKLSAGEKQLMVISILWALAICSKKKLPVIIDTPLSRLDSSHRSSLVTNYFPHASEQTIILSTDTEITPEYYEMLKPSIGDEFYLDYNEDTKSTTIRRGYFKESETK